MEKNSKRIIIGLSVFCFMTFILLIFIALPKSSMKALSFGQVNSEKFITYLNNIDSKATTGVDYEGMYIDLITEQLSSGKIVFKTPEVMRKGDKEDVQLLLSLNEDSKKLLERIDATSSDKVEEALIRVSNRMSAVLSGSGFKVVLITPEEQLISLDKPTEWRWEITSLEKGKNCLYLSLNALLYLGSEKSPQTIRTFQKEIVVNYPFWCSFKDFFRSNWQWLWTTLLPGAIWLYIKRNKKPRRHSPTKPSKLQKPINVEDNIC